jgi:hypothetical protein
MQTTLFYHSTHPTNSNAEYVVFSLTLTLSHRARGLGR